MNIDVWDDGVWSGDENMSMDVDLVSHLQGGWCARVYGWDGPWVSLGRFQKRERALLPKCPIPYVMRPTGGKAVLHGHDLTVGMMADLQSLGLQERRIGQVYRAVIRPLVAALNLIGIEAALAEDTPFVRTQGMTADCFAYNSPNDIVDPRHGTKVCGCALRVDSGTVLVQASIPVGVPSVDPLTVFQNPAPVPPPRPIVLAEGRSKLAEALLASLIEAVTLTKRS